MDESSIHAVNAASSGKVAKPAQARTKLPLARVKKIAKMDEDVIALSNSAALVISGATVSSLFPGD